MLSERSALDGVFIGGCLGLVLLHAGLLDGLLVDLFDSSGLILVLVRRLSLSCFTGAHNLISVVVVLFNFILMDNLSFI